MNSLTEMLLKLDSFNTLKKALEKNSSKVNLQGVLDSQKEHLVFAVSENLNNKSIVVTHTERKAKELYENLKFYYKEKVYHYPQKDILFYSADVKSVDIMKERSKIYEQLFSNNDIVIVLSIDALFDRLSPKEILEKHFIDIKVGDEFSLETLSKHLINIGYKRRSIVENPGQFAIRGGIIDIFSTSHSTAARIEFWGDEVDSIRILDEYNNRSIEKIDFLRVSPISELIFSQDELYKAITKITKEYTESLSNFEKYGLLEEYDNLRHSFSQILEELKEFGSCKNMELLIPYFYEEKISLFDYLSKDFIVYFDDITRIDERGRLIELEYNESLNNRLTKGYMLKTSTKVINTLEDIFFKCKNVSCVNLTSIMASTKNELFKNSTTIDFNVKYPLTVKNDIVAFKDELKSYKEDGYTVILLCGSKTRGKTLLQDLADENVYGSFYDNLNDVVLENNIYVIRGTISKGFIYPDLKIAVLSDSEVFVESKNTKRKKFKDGKKINSYTDLQVGDYIVHINHGIGVFKGVEKITVDGVSKDYIKVGFADGGNIYAPTNQLDLIQKYIGKESKNIKLNKLGSSDWNNTKQRTKKAVMILAKDLLELYAKREQTKGYEYSEDTTWQKEFENDFLYQETDDQLNAIYDVKSDMESTKVMDRLICGDVGYGKTEVAIRAAFKAVQDSKQVAYLCPTTILAQQHYNTFTQRLKDYPINVELLSRFRTKKEIEKSIENIKNGKSDILIGTHRLLSKDVSYKDLGLVIVDEEQRFGVSHKEKLKKLKENVDVLTLTATPIPRTLHMSMTGIRDMSVLSEPPQERVPIQTYVLENNDEYIKEAIQREVNRNGQVFFLHNRVNSIESVANRIQGLVPNAKVVYAHGQMSERELENIMKDFINHEYDVLVCTTIIETGLDISNANTIIIDNADTMGLSTLYQLRGRVGRSHRNAFAYLLYKRDKVISEIAEKRLETIKQFTEFGSGFKVAMRDLEIRGAGTLLGEQQSGHLETVGYEMYCSLLEQAIQELKGESVAEEITTVIELQTSAYIPEYYIQDELQKIEIYKKIALLRTEEDEIDLEDELIDRFGDIPKETTQLINIALTKVYLNNLGIISLLQNGQYVHITCNQNAKLSLPSIDDINKKDFGRIKLTLGKNPLIIYKIKGDYKKKGYDILGEINEFISSIELKA
ncbi:MAG: transcription-repair coupling factor [Lachnospirales bacterium]